MILLLRNKKMLSSSFAGLLLRLLGIHALCSCCLALSMQQQQQQQPRCSSSSQQHPELPPLSSPPAKTASSSSFLTTRRQTLMSGAGCSVATTTAILTTTTTSAAGQLSKAVVAAYAAADETTDSSSSSSSSAPTTPYSFETYQVNPDDSPNRSPTLTKLDNMDAFFQQILSSSTSSPSSPFSVSALWLGEHHSSSADHNLQLQIIQHLVEQTSSKPTSNSNSSTTAPANKIAIGLEQVQVQFQPILDQYISGELTLSQLRSYIQWDERWMWDFTNYAPIFEFARAKNIPLIALNVNSEDLKLVERNGLPGLDKQRLKYYIQDPPGFAKYAQPRDFRTYVDYVIEPSYEFHLGLGLLQQKPNNKEDSTSTMSFRNFLSGRLLWDETMATRAYQWTKQNPNGLLVGLVGADHVKFNKGVPGRFDRLLSLNQPSGGAADVAVGNDPSRQQTRSSISVLLNPTVIDTQPSGTVESNAFTMSPRNVDYLTLQLRYLREEDTATATTAATTEELRSSPMTGGVLPLADYLLLG